MKTATRKKHRAFIVLQISGSYTGWYSEVRRTRGDALARMRQIRAAGDGVLGPFECDAQIARHGKSLLALLDKITYALCQRRLEVDGAVPVRCSKRETGDLARQHRTSGSSRTAANGKYRARHSCNQKP